MALNLLGNGYGNQNYSPAQSSGTVSNLVNKYGKSELKRTITTKTPGQSRTRTETRTIAEPEREYAKYEGPEGTTATIRTKDIFGTTPKQRKEYVRDVEDYNKQVQSEKKKVADYNKEVDQWNKSGRFKKVTRTYTETPTVTITKTMTIPTGKVSVMTTPKSTGTITTKTLTSKERLDAISKPKDYLEGFKEKKEKLDFIKTQETKVSDFGKNLSGGIKFAYKTFKERGITGLDAEVKKQESIFYPKAKDRIKEGYNYVTGGSGIFKYTNPLFYVSKGTEGISRTGTNLVKDFPSTSEKAYQGSLQLRGATIQSAKFITAYDPRDTLRGVKSKFSNQPNLREFMLSAYNTVYTPADKLSKINYKEDLKDFYKGTKKVGNLILTSEYKPEMETKKIGGFTFTVRKEPTAFEKRYQTAKSIELLTNPKTYYFTAGVLGESAIFNLPRVVKPLKDEWLKFGATYVDPKDVFSKQSFKNDKLTNALVRTKSVPDAFGSLSKTKGIYKEYPEHYVLQSSLQDDLPKTFGVLSQKQKIAKGLKVRYEDDVMWYGTKGEGAVWALRISPNDKYALGVLPNWTKTSQPAILETLVKRGQRLPKDVLFKEGFELQGEYQRFKTLTKPSIALFPKRSEASKIGYDITRAKVKSIDPALRGSSELQFGTFPGTLNVPAKKLLTTPLGRFKGFEEYTIAYGQVIPIRKGIISGASIYTPGPRAELYRQFLKSKPLAVGQKGSVNILSSNKISKSLNDYLYDYGVSSHQRSIAQNYGKDAISLAYSNASNQSLIKIPTASFFRGLRSDSDSVSKDNKYNIKLLDYDSRYNNRDTSSGIYRPTKQTYITKPVKYTTDVTSTYTETSTDYGYDNNRRTEKSEYKSTPPTYYPNAPSRPSLTYKFDSGDTRYKFTPVIPKKRKEYVSGEPAYDVLIKVGNKWVNKTNGKRNVYSAIHRGTEIVDNTTAKSFKIKKGTGIANIFKYNAPYNINKFYTPSKTRSAKLTGAYIEKNKYAIDTPGERKGLSVAKYLRGVKLI
ncbi:MAG TPA: hypothetical protein P5098_00480 [Candidatus Dojkabacteria bacterium]|nr:hypothetical protein [Candidatus Dojkabacteria bacterium]